MMKLALEMFLAALAHNGFKGTFGIHLPVEAWEALKVEVFSYEGKRGDRTNFLHYEMQSPPSVGITLLVEPMPNVLASVKQ